ncbi:MAG: TetR/AcrR family transcriptional regulator [Chloroflexales bacterium]|nr:TetR/AcrR family transcriptional regulator [Chloroflexales bacterium]
MDATNTGERRARKDVQRNLERVLQAAHALFAERGDDVTMEEVARRAGVGVGTIYRRFPSKEHLFAAVSDAARADVQACLHSACAQHADPASKLRALVVTQYRRSEQQAALIDLRPDADDCPHDQQSLYAALHAILADVIAEGQLCGDIRPGDPNALAAICLELLSPRTFQHLQRVVGGRAEDVAEHAVHFVLGGLGADRR